MLENDRMGENRVRRQSDMVESPHHVSFSSVCFTPPPRTVMTKAGAIRLFSLVEWLDMLKSQLDKNLLNYV
jgi:hypothetical protein